jgi:hypothetical protein
MKKFLSFGHLSVSIPNGAVAYLHRIKIPQGFGPEFSSTKLLFKKLHV